MKHGDFTELAKFYVHRAGYSKSLLSFIKNAIQNEIGREPNVADVGAGTGKLTENLMEIGLKGFAVEPNDAMRNQGELLFGDRDSFKWSKGAAESTGLDSECVDWVLMGSSFHWTDGPVATEEFKRIVRPGGYFTAIWNPRDLKRSELHIRIEDMIYEQIPGMKRVSSGGIMTTEGILERMGGEYDVFFMEARHTELMSKERYMNIWKSVNDIRVQAGEEKFALILENIEEILKDMDTIEVPYLSRAWTAKIK